MAQINFKVDDQLKTEAEELFEQLGLPLGTALTMFLKKALRAHGIPFEVRLEDPFYGESNMAHLQKVFDDINAGRNVQYHELIEDNGDEKAVA